MIQGEWKSDVLDADGETSWTVKEDTGTESESTTQIISMNSTGGSPLNLCYSLVAPQLKYFYQVEFLEAASRSTSLSVGVVRPCELRKGWGTKGLFYNGNLTNGSAALKVGYGPYLKQGDTAIVEYTESPDKYQVKFHINGRCLGIAFEILKEQTSASPDESFLPCLNCQGELRVRTTFHLEQPKNKKCVSEVHPLHGKWSLLKSYEHTSDGRTQIWPLASTTEHDIVSNSAEPRTVTLNLEPYTSSDVNGCWAMVLKVFNTIRVLKLVYTGDNVHGSNKGYDFLLAEPPGSPPGATSTMMMPPPPFDEIERKLSHALGLHWRKLKLGDNDDTLQVLSGDGTTLAHFERQRSDSNTVACTSYR